MGRLSLANSHCSLSRWVGNEEGGCVFIRASRLAPAPASCTACSTRCLPMDASRDSAPCSLPAHRDGEAGLGAASPHSLLAGNTLPGGLQGDSAHLQDQRARHRCKSKHPSCAAPSSPRAFAPVYSPHRDASWLSTSIPVGASNNRALILSFLSLSLLAEAAGEAL